MMQMTLESRSRHWEIKLIQSTNFPPDLIPQIAYILAQDDVEGLNARTPAQIAFMGHAVDSRKIPQ